jgi:hypothetical protein
MLEWVDRVLRMEDGRVLSAAGGGAARAAQ